MRQTLPWPPRPRCHPFVAAVAALLGLALLGPALLAVALLGLGLPEAKASERPGQERTEGQAAGRQGAEPFRQIVESRILHESLLADLTRGTDRDEF